MSSSQARGTTPRQSTNVIQRARFVKWDETESQVGYSTAIRATPRTQSQRQEEFASRDFASATHGYPTTSAKRQRVRFVDQVESPAEGHLEEGPPVEGFVGFATAGKRAPVAPSAAAMKKAQSMLATEAPSAAETAPPTGSKTPLAPSDDATQNADAPVGFARAGSKTRVSASDESMKKAGALLSKTDDQDDTAFAGFARAGSNAKVMASDAAMKRAGAIMDAAAEDDTVGFSRAGSKARVVASEAATRRGALVLDGATALPTALGQQQAKTPVHSSATSLRPTVPSAKENTVPRASKTAFAAPAKRSGALSAGGLPNRKKPHCLPTVAPPPPPATEKAPRTTGLQRVKAPSRGTAYKPPARTTATTTATSTKEESQERRRHSLTLPLPLARRRVVPVPREATRGSTTRARQAVACLPRVSSTLDFGSVAARVTSTNAETVVFELGSPGSAAGLTRKRELGALKSARGLEAAMSALRETRPLGLIAASFGGTTKAAANKKKSKAALAKAKAEEDLFATVWTLNHYRWLVWKAACLERVFGPPLTESPLAFPRILRGLERRFDKEVAQAKRSALRAILQHDASPKRLTFYCVSQVLSRDTVELTDGWYAVKALLDDALAYHLRVKRIKVGTKLAVCNARLEGGPVDPIQDLADTFSQPGETTTTMVSPSARLRLCGNSVRRARAHVKLGFHPRLHTMNLPLDAVVANLGPVPAFDAVISRVVLAPDDDDVLDNEILDDGETGGGTQRLPGDDDDKAGDDDDDQMKSDDDDDFKAKKKPVKEEQQKSRSSVEVTLVAPRASSSAVSLAASRPAAATLSVPSARWQLEGDEALREGDSVRCFDCDPVAMRRDDGLLCFRFGRRSRLSRLASPAPRTLAASCWYRPRSLAGPADVVAAVRLRTASGGGIATEALCWSRRADVVAVVVDIVNDDFLYLADRSPYLLVVNLRDPPEKPTRNRGQDDQDAAAAPGDTKPKMSPELRRARSAKAGDVVALFDLDLSSSRIVAPSLASCDWSKDSRFCSTMARLDDVARASTSRTFVFCFSPLESFAGIRDDFESLRKWARTRAGGRALEAAAEQLETLLVPPPADLGAAVSLAVVELLQAHSDGLTIEDIRRLALTPRKKTQVSLDTIDAAVEKMQADFSVYFNPDGDLFKLL